VNSPGDAQAPAVAGGRVDVDARPVEDGRSWVSRVLINREFSRLWMAQLIGSCGDWVGFFAITALAASISGEPEAATALVLTARVAPSFFLAPIMGVLVDRFDRKVMMRIADIGRACVMISLPFVGTLWGLIVASLILEAFTLMWAPAKEAMVPAIVPAERLTNANSLGLLVAYGTMPFAGVLQFLLKKGNEALAGVSWLGPFQFDRTIGDTQALAFYFDASTYLIVAFIVWRCIRTSGSPGAVSASTGSASTGSVAHGAAPLPALADPPAPPVPGPATEPSMGVIRGAFAGIREGWHYIFVNPVVRAVNLGLAAGLLGGAMLVPLGPTFASKVTGDVNTFSLYITAMGLGVAIAVAIINVVQDQIPKASVFTLMLSLAGVSLLFAVSMSTFWLQAIGVFGLGLGAGSVYVLGFTLLQENTDDAIRGRIFSTLLTLVRVCVLAAMVLGPALSALFDPIAKRVFPGGGDHAGPGVTVFGQWYGLPGVRFTLWLAGITVLVASVVASRALKVGFRANLRGITEEVRQVRRDRSDDGSRHPVITDDELTAVGVDPKRADRS
jgi:dTMP kinase